MRNSFSAALQDFGVWLIRSGRGLQAYSAEAFRDVMNASPSEAAPFEGDESLLLVTSAGVTKRVSVSTLKQWVLGKFNLTASDFSGSALSIGHGVFVRKHVFLATNVAIGSPVIGNGSAAQV